jgi:hypothetical protein
MRPAPARSVAGIGFTLTITLLPLFVRLLHQEIRNCATMLSSRLAYGSPGLNRLRYLHHRLRSMAAIRDAAEELCRAFV